MKLGLCLGAVLLLATGAAYLAPLREPGAWFYAFAALVFVVSPLIGAVTAVLATRANRLRNFLAAGSALIGLAALLFVVAYAVYPEFERTSVQLTPYCGDFGSGDHPPPGLVYNLPGVGTTTLMTSDAESAVVAAIDFAHAPFPSTVYLVHKSDGRILWSMDFANDILSAALGAGTLYLYNDKLGYWIDARTGLPTHNFFTIDNYGGLSPTDRPVLVAGAATGHWYMETTGVISSWRADGSVVSRRHFTFNSIAFSCFIAGLTGSVTQL